MSFKRIPDLTDQASFDAAASIVVDKAAFTEARKMDLSILEDQYVRQIIGSGLAKEDVFGALDITLLDTAALPVVKLTQQDLSEEMIEFSATVGVGNPIEGVGAKTLTVTHFIRISITGVGLLYIPCGTIA
ncbi:MAG TPA: hypothetical protein VGD99_21845 [Anaerolineae bacterium]|jgi:hypothetical protein